MINGFIYKWTNIKTGKRYIGSHKGTTDDGYISSSVPFMKDYNISPDDFYREILEETTYCNITELRQREQYFFDKFNVVADETFYNQKNVFGWELIDNSGENNPMYGKPYTEDRRKKTQETWKKKIEEGYVGYWAGKKNPTASERFQKEYLIIHPCGKKELIKNLSNFCKEFNLNPSALVGVAKGRRKQFKGFKCYSVVDGTPEIVEFKPKTKIGNYGANNGQSKKVTINGKVYSCKREAMEVLGISLYKLNKMLKD